jgi:acyl-CoA thioester hydrolase
MMNTEESNVGQRRDEEVFTVRLAVRDYECDQGQGVNHAVYLHYLEHCRWEYVRKYLKWDVNYLLKQNIGFVVAKIDIEFRRSLVSCDEFVVETKMQRIEKRRFQFRQEIYLMKGDEKASVKPIAIADVVIAAINSATPQVLEDLLYGFPILELAGNEV